MRINSISANNVNFGRKPKLNTDETNKDSNSKNILKRGLSYAAAAVLAFNMGLAPYRKANATEFTPDYQVYNVDYRIDSDVSLESTPVSELYFTNGVKENILNPNKDLVRNSNGTLLTVITPEVSETENEGSTLREILNKVYSNALSQYNGEQKDAIFNKLIDETLQANPGHAAYIKEQLGSDVPSYDAIADYKLYRESNNGNDNILIIPETIYYRSQVSDPKNTTYEYQSNTYTPKSEMASVIKDANNLSENEYSSFEEMIYGQYGKDISDEAYRDIVYSVVNNPLNASMFEVTAGKLNINELLQTASITDLNRTLDENTDKTLLNVYLPDVTTLRTFNTKLGVTNYGKEGTVCQISPAKVVEGQNDKVILLESQTGEKKPGDVHELRDVLQFYSSPNGQGRFASVSGGKLKLNNIEYGNQFATNILSQVVYNNIGIFTIPYSDNDGDHEFGVFDVNQGYDTTGKSIDDIIRNSKINTERLYNFSFDHFEGEQLYLPQFRYIVHTGKISGIYATPSPEPTQTPVIPTEAPATPTQAPATPTQAPATPTQAPTATPTKAPTATPTKAPTATPTKAPTATPTKAPTATPTKAPTAEPSKKPNPSASNIPVQSPPPPSGEPTCGPTARPDDNESESGNGRLDGSGGNGSDTTETPTAEPTAAPTAATTCEPTPTPENPNPEDKPTTGDRGKTKNNTYVNEGKLTANVIEPPASIDRKKLFGFIKNKLNKGANGEEKTV